MQSTIAMDWSVITAYCDATTLLVSICLAVLLAYIFTSKRPSNYPPGPPGLPLIGYAPFIGLNMGETFMELRKKYGPVLSVQLGREDWIVLNDYEAIQEGFVKQGKVFSGRPGNIVLDELNELSGVKATDYGSEWRNLKKFGLTALRGLGVGKKSLEDNVIEESSSLMDAFTTDVGGTVNYKLAMAASNVICRVIFGDRFGYKDKRFKSLVDLLQKLLSDSWDVKLLAVMVFAPPLRHLPVFKGAFESIKKEFKEDFLGLFQTIIDEHKSSYDEAKLRDFIDAFLREMKKNKNDPGFSELHLLHYIRDLFEAGSGTVSSQLSWCIFTLAHFPETQEKIYKEVFAVLGENGKPSMEHRRQMPYTCAFLEEVTRLNPSSPVPFFHKTTQEASLNGFTIPKDTVVVANVWGVQHDPELFSRPESFTPERFLDEDGKFVKSNHVIPFSVGPRRCLGEQLARMEFFIFVTSIVQKLKILPDLQNPLPAYSSSKANGLSFDPPEFSVNFEKRPIL